jgi:hypothetical protein
MPGKMPGILPGICWADASAFATRRKLFFPASRIGVQTPIGYRKAATRQL